nr:hypothetical protein [Tanacetum cinerariifolium]
MEMESHLHVVDVKECLEYENYLWNLYGNNSHDGYDCQQQFPFVYEQEPSYNQNYDEDEIECDVPDKDNCSPAFTTFSNHLFNNDDLDSNDDESLPDEDVPVEDFKVYLNLLFDEDEMNSNKLDPHCFNVESDFVKSLLNRDTFIDSSFKFDFSGELAHVNPEILKSDFDFEEEIFQDGDSQREEINIVIETEDMLPPSVENDDDSSNHPLLEEADLFLSDNSIPPGIEKVADDPEGDVHFLEELLIDNSILSHESSDSNFKDNPSMPRPPPKPPDAETDAGEEILVVMNDKDKDVDYFSFIFVIFDKVFSFLFAKSEDTIFDPGKEGCASWDLGKRTWGGRERGFGTVPVLAGVQEEAVEEKQELLAEEQAANPSEPLPVSYFYNADYDEIKRIQQILEKTSFDAITPDVSITVSLTMEDEYLSTIPETESDEIDPHYFNAESNILKSLLNRDTLIGSSPKFDYLLEDFSGELAHIDPITPGTEEADFDLEEEIHLVENLSYDYSSPRPPKKLNVEITYTILESLSPSPIPVEDSDSHMEEIDLFLAMDDLMPPGIENDDYDSKGDIHFLKELLSNNPIPLPENESSNFHHHDDPSFPRPPLEPPDVEVFFDFKPDTGVLTTKVVKGISEHYVLMPNIFPTLDLDLDFTPSHDSLRSGNKIFDPGIFIEVQSREFYHGMNFPFLSSVILFIQCLTLCSRFHPKTRTKCSNMVQRIENKAKTNPALEQLVLVVSLRSRTQGRLFDSAGELYIPSATWTYGTQSADVALPRRLT